MVEVNFSYGNGAEVVSNNVKLFFENGRWRKKRKGGNYGFISVIIIEDYWCWYAIHHHLRRTTCIFLIWHLKHNSLIPYWLNLSNFIFTYNYFKIRILFNRKTITFKHNLCPVCSWTWNDWIYPQTNGDLFSLVNIRIAYLSNMNFWFSFSSWKTHGSILTNWKFTVEYLNTAY